MILPVISDAVPCVVPQEVDLLLLQWDIGYMQLEKAETTFEDAGLLERPEHNLRCCGCTGTVLRYSGVATMRHALCILDTGMLSSGLIIEGFQQFIQFL